MPAANNGWMIFSADSLRLAKYSSCGFIEWAKKFYMQDVILGLYDFIKLNNGDYAFMNRQQKNGPDIVAVTRLDPSGNIIWSKSYGDAGHEHFPYTLLEDNNGNLIVYGNVSVWPNNGTSYNDLIKIDAAGNLLWTKFYNFGGIWGGAITTSDNGFLFRTGDFFVKTDGSGNVIWTKYHTSDTYYYLAPVEVADGYIFSAYTNSGNYITYFKIDKSGNQLWGGGKTLSIAGNPRRLYTLPNGNIVSVFQKSGEATVIEFDKDLNIVKENSINNSGSLSARDICLLSDGTNVISGISSGGYSFFAHLNANYKSGCDITTPPLVITPAVSSMNPTAVTASNHNFNTYTENYLSDTFNIQVTTYCIPDKKLELGPDTSTCIQNNFILSNLMPDSFDIYQWSTGETTSSIVVSQSGKYYLEVKDACGEIALSDSIEITFLGADQPELGNDFVLCENESRIIQAYECDSCVYSWNTGSTTDTIVVSDPGIYIVTLTNNEGCSASDTIIVEQSKCECNLYLPKAFTPNSDAKNESFGALYYCDLSEFKLVIFNRWGELIFSTDNPNTFWDGKYRGSNATEGVYVYSLQYSSIIKGVKSNPLKKNGTITLIR
jgi:gliding motility-associated-like protein